jgi:hypothetical protein
MGAIRSLGLAQHGVSESEPVMAGSGDRVIASEAEDHKEPDTLAQAPSPIRGAWRYVHAADEADMPERAEFQDSVEMP